MNAVDEYLAALGEPQKSQLKRVRDIIRQLVPDANETVSYGMPAFRFRGQPLMYFGAFKNHMSLFPTAAPAEALKDKLEAAGHLVSKGTVRFSADNPVSETLIKELLVHRLEAIYRHTK